jgi:hypothetical protein
MSKALFTSCEQTATPTCLNHWPKLTLFLQQPGAPLDDNIAERALKKAILNRKNALFYKTLNGAESLGQWLTAVMSMNGELAIPRAGPPGALCKRRAIVVALQPPSGDTEMPRAELAEYAREQAARTRRSPRPGTLEAESR